MPTLVKFLLLSRPHFWSYLAGPFFLGYIVAISNKTELLSAQFFFMLFFFLFPANLFLYGVNDLSDKDTDKLNPKKSFKEQKATKTNQNLYIVSIVFAVICSFPVFFILNTPAKILFIAFAVLSSMYSLPPFRLKAKPVLDFSSNILYAFPGFIGYAQVTHHFPPLFVWIIAFCWTAAMHIFSAIPDIKYDKKTKLQTSAVVLGKKNSLWLCFILWSAVCITCTIINSIFFITIVYPVSILGIIFYKKSDIERVYWLFPIVNTVIGFIFFLVGAAKLL